MRQFLNESGNPSPYTKATDAHNIMKYFYLFCLYLTRKAITKCHVCFISSCLQSVLQPLVKSCAIRLTFLDSNCWDQGGKCRHTISHNPSHFTASPDTQFRLTRNFQLSAALEPTVNSTWLSVWLKAFTLGSSLWCRQQVGFCPNDKEFRHVSSPVSQTCQRRRVSLLDYGPRWKFNKGLRGTICTWALCLVGGEPAMKLPTWTTTDSFSGT